MSIILPNNHLSLTTEDDINSICKSLFQKTSITFFDYARIFDDGFCYMLSSNRKLISYQCEMTHPFRTPPPSNLLREKFYYFAIETGPASQVLYEMSNFFNLSNFINFYEQGTGYIDIFGFASSIKSNEIINFYLNNIYFLENFICYFKEKISNLHKALQQHKVLIPAYRRLDFNSEHILQLSKNYNPKLNNLNLSKRETECIYHLSLGKTAKEIGKTLNLSFRTVEFYINNIKNKWNCSKRSELIDKALKMELK